MRARVIRFMLLFILCAVPSIAGGSSRPPTVLAAPGVPTISVFPAPAPNAFGSPSFSGWVTNAQNALQNGLTSIGNPGLDPTAYFQVNIERDRDNIVTSFPSWHGVANPGTNFGAAFSNELGNRLHFGVHILGNGTKISLSGLSFNMHSSDPGNTFGFTGDFTSPSDVYSATRIGIINSPPTVINSGPATQLVDELDYVGVGNAQDNSSCSGTDQAQLDCVKALYDTLMPFTFATDYTLVYGVGQQVTGSASVLFNFTLNKVGQTITFGAIAPHTYGDPPFTVSASASSGLIVSFTGTGNCGVVDNGNGTATVSLTAAGSCTVTAHQPGNSTYAAAPDVPRSFTIGQATTITTLLSSSNPALVGQKVTLRATVSSATGAPTGSVTFHDGNASLGTATLSGGHASLGVSSLTAGSHSITASYGGDSLFLGSTSAILPQLVYGLNASSVSPLTATVGVPLTGVLVATFTDDDPDPGVHHYTGTINWGDGHTGTGFISSTGSSSFAVRGSHTYSVTTAHTITVTIQAADGRTAQATSSISIHS